MSMLSIGVDAHKRVHAAVAVDGLGRRVAEWRGANTAAGWAELAAWATRFDGARQWGIEGAWQYGRGLAQLLVSQQETVVDVNPRLTAAMRRGSREHAKTDRLDAQAVARVVGQEGAALPVVAAEEGTAVLALWTQEREAAQAAATRLRNQVHQVLTQLDPTYAETLPSLTTAAGVAALRDYQPVHDTVLAQHQAAMVRRIGAQLALLAEQIGDVTRQLARVGTQQYAPLTDICGVGPLTAAMLAGILGPGQRFATDAQLAKYAGAAPIEASSGERVRHRLNRGGHRQLNAILERIALTQARCSPEAQAYLAKKRGEGKTRREAIRALKRFLARAIWRAWQQCQPLSFDALATMIAD